MTILQSGISQAASATGYQIARSLRFNIADSTYLGRTPSSNGNQQKWTWSAWVKRSTLSSACKILAFGTPTSSESGFAITGSDVIEFYQYGGSYAFQLVSTQVLRDVTAWYHFVAAVDTTQATASNRIKLYINGSQITSFTTSTYPSQNLNTYANSTSHGNHLGNLPGQSQHFGGYLAEVNFIDGQQLTPTSFGETSTTTGVWNPIAYAGTYGTNGFYLNFSDNSNTTAATLGKDYSGNSNNFTPTNFSVTAGSGNDSLVDSPTNYGGDSGIGGQVRGNYCTLNPLDKGPDVNTVVNGNLDATWNSNNGHTIRSTMSVSSGKWYWEFTNVNNLSCGIVKSELKIIPASGSLWPGSDGFGVGGSYAYRPDNGNKTTNSTGTSYGATFTTTDIIGCALDLDNGKIWWSKNGTFIASGDPAAGTNEAYSGLSGNFSPAWGYINPGSNTLTVNFGQRAFAYSAPSGFKALCAKNLPTPAIGASSTTLASKNFKTVLYTGNGSTQSITGVGFQPDLVWVKNRPVNANHRLFDSVRGASKVLFPSNTDAEVTDAGGMTSFDADGFSIGANQVNDNTNTFVAWNWKTGSAAVTNTSGTISSQVSASPTAGISVVTYTGNGTSGATVGHGLGVAPAMYIIKRRSSTENWCTYHKALGATKAVFLNLTDAQNTNSVFFNNTEPTSLVFSIGNNTSVNASGSTYVAHCFSEITGFSKFGSYTGNGSTDGAFIYLGFRPAFFIVKLTSSGIENWTMHDSTRDSFNLVNKKLYPSGNFTEAADTNNTCDFLSNGIKLRDAYNGWNASGSTYIFMAFAEAPFNYSRAR